MKVPNTPIFSAYPPPQTNHTLLQLRAACHCLCVTIAPCLIPDLCLLCHSLHSTMTSPSKRNRAEFEQRSDGDTNDDSDVLLLSAPSPVLVHGPTTPTPRAGLKKAKLPLMDADGAPTQPGALMGAADKSETHGIAHVSSNVSHVPNESITDAGTDATPTHPCAGLYSLSACLPWCLCYPGNGGDFWLQGAFLHQSYCWRRCPPNRTLTRRKS